MHGPDTGTRRDGIRRKPSEKSGGRDRELEQGVHLGERALVIDSITETAQNGDYRKLAGIFDGHEGVGNSAEGTGYVDGKLISDTGEICFDPDHARYTVHTPYCGYFSGAPEEEISLCDEVKVTSANDRITLALIGKKRRLLQRHRSIS